MNTFVTHLESALDGTRFPAGQVHTVHQGRPLWVRYDLAAVRAAVTPEQIARRAPSLWRYRELLPLPFDAEPVTLGEGMTPLLPCPRLGKALGLSRLFIKDESQLPTGSFKSRGMTTAVSMAKHFGLRGWPSPRPATPAAPWRPTGRGRAWRFTCSCPRTRRRSTASRRGWPAPR